MNDFLLIHRKIQELPRGWGIERTPQIFAPAPTLRNRLALAAGRFFIATGEKLVRLAAIPLQREKKAI
ncbi:MAG: hypothetical protein Fur0016_19060 [Anaerolineales bacterium]